MRSIVVHRVRLFAETGAASLSTFEAINHIGEDIETLLKLQGLLVQCAYFADNFVELTVKGGQFSLRLSVHEGRLVSYRIARSGTYHSWSLGQRA
jgi:hypothetical protein